MNIASYLDLCILWNKDMKDIFIREQICINLQCAYNILFQKCNSCSHVLLIHFEMVSTWGQGDQQILLNMCCILKTEGQHTRWCCVCIGFWKNSFQQLFVLWVFMEEHRNCPTRCMHRNLPRYVTFYFEFMFQGHSVWCQVSDKLHDLEIDVSLKCFYSKILLKGISGVSPAWLLSRRKTRCKITC